MIIHELHETDFTNRPTIPSILHKTKNKPQKTNTKIMCYNYFGCCLGLPDGICALHNTHIICSRSPLL